jgi:hypothetical protein
MIDRIRVPALVQISASLCASQRSNAHALPITAEMVNIRKLFRDVEGLPLVDGLPTRLPVLLRPPLEGPYRDTFFGGICVVACFALRWRCTRLV